MGKDLQGNTLPDGIVQRKNGSYRGRFQYKGEIYTRDSIDLKKLIQEMEDLRYEVKHGLKGKGDNVTLDTWFDVWLNTHKRRTIKESTQVRYDDFYHRYIQNQIGKRRMVDFTPIVLERLLQDMADKEYSTKTIRDVYNILNAMFKYAVHNRLITFNPCGGVEIPKTKTKSIRVLTVEEQQEVLQHAKGRTHENLIRVALGTGMRAGELLGLTWEDIDFRKREISVNKTMVYIKELETKKYVFKYQTPKTKNSIRTIPMQDSVYKALKRQKIQVKEMQMACAEWKPLESFENLVFVGKNGKPVTEHSFQATLNGIENAINKARQKNAEKKDKDTYEPMPHFYPHALRHTFATRCFEAGIDAKVVQGFLGHYSIAITLDLYTHVTNDKAKSEMDKLQNLYQKII
ncbi:tyrosine-type recombinase/integrase [Lachnospiraceae bacterium 42-17]